MLDIVAELLIPTACVFCQFRGVFVSQCWVFLELDTSCVNSFRLKWVLALQKNVLSDVQEFNEVTDCFQRCTASWCSDNINHLWYSRQSSVGNMTSLAQTTNGHMSSPFSQPGPWRNYPVSSLLFGLFFLKQMSAWTNYRLKNIWNSNLRECFIAIVVKIVFFPPQNYPLSLRVIEKKLSIWKMN